MSRPDTQSTTADQPTREPLSGKAWAALAAVCLFVCVFAWVLTSVLTASPSVDPTVHADAVALATSDQPDPNQPSRYADLLDALIALDRQIDTIANDLVDDEESLRTGIAELNFYAIVEEPDPTDEDAEVIAQQAADARRAVEAILARNLFDDLFEILRAPNLANEYPGAFDASGNLIPMYEWLLPELGTFREHSMTVVGSVRALTERGDIDEAAALLEGIAPLPGVLTRQITLVEHLVGYAIAALITQEIEYLAAHPDLTAEALASLHRAHDLLSDIGSLETAIDGESIFLRDFHYRTHTSGGRYIPSAGNELGGTWGGTAIDNSLLTKLTDASGYLAVRRDTSIAKAEQLYGLMRDAINEADPTRRAGLMNEFDREIQSLGPRYTLLQLMMPAISRTVTNMTKMRAQSAALGILLAMAEYRLDHGDWPTSLDQLVPNYLPSIPTNPQTGDPFEYEYTPGEAPTLEALGASN